MEASQENLKLALRNGAEFERVEPQPGFVTISVRVPTEYIEGLVDVEDVIALTFDPSWRRTWELVMVRRSEGFKGWEDPQPPTVDEVAERVEERGDERPRQVLGID